MVIARDVWDTPRTGWDPNLFSVLDTHARMLLDQLPSPTDITGACARRSSGAARGQPSPSRPNAAMSPRTLQRRSGTRASLDVLEAMRFRAAKSYLAQRDVAGTEVAYLLGFAEQSSFNRAFKRWSAQTPTNSEGRARQLRVSRRGAVLISRGFDVGEGPNCPGSGLSR
jgi:hypothetical protein